MEELTFKVCDHCHEKMSPQTMSQTFRFNGKEIEIKGIQGFGEGTICGFEEALKFYNDHKGE